jgi:hypothetical protein
MKMENEKSVIESIKRLKLSGGQAYNLSAD